VPHHKSATIRLRSDARKRSDNRAVKSRMRTAIKKLRSCNDPAEATSLLHSAVSAIDTAAQKGAIQRGTADRQKSRLARYVNTLAQGNQ
jgi:small subunit ribosomal protein S20